MKKRFSVMLVLCLTISMFAGCLTGFAATPEVVQKSSYADVGEDHWAYEWVTFMTSNNYIHGYPSVENGGLDLYKPDQYITRAEVATILYFMLNPQGSMTASFTDVAADDWYYEYISKAVAAGYMSGYGDGSMKPNAYITREEASSIVYRAFKIDMYTDVTEFLDSDDISSWAYTAVMSLADLGIIAGYTGEVENEFYVRPHVNIKRAEIASLLANADKFYPTSVTLGEAEDAFDKTAGGTVAFDMFPKNTSDNLSVAVSVDTGAEYTVTYTVDGVEKTATAEEFAAETFTADELANLNIVINFPKVTEGTLANVTVSVTDGGDTEDTTDDAVVGEVTYAVEFKTEEIQGGDDDKDTEYAPITGGGGGNKTPSTDDPTDDCDVDRVITAIEGYKAMATKGTSVATTNVLSADVTTDFAAGSDTHDKAHDEANSKWWTNDMLEVIVTNDNNHLEDGEYTGVTAQTTLKPIYDDVARYVVDNYDTFANATIDATTKHDYIKYFRAMISTIDAAAIDAAEAYDDAKENGGNSSTAYAAFVSAAIEAVDSALATAISNEGITDTAAIDKLGDLAVEYVALLYAKVDDTIKTELETLYGTSADLDAFKTGVATMIANNAIYAK